jgi:RIP metalloprotease RseP
MTDIDDQAPGPDGIEAPAPVQGGRFTTMAQGIESRGVGVRDPDGDEPPRSFRERLSAVLPGLAVLVAIVAMWPSLWAAGLYVAVAVAVIGLTDDEVPAWRYARMGVLLAGAVLLGIWRPWILVVVVALVFMIFMHELGHYLMAKRAGMKVTEFFIFFGPKIWSFRRGETEYGIKCIPAGAYVKIVGMTNLEEVDPADEARTYRQKSFWQRVGVAVAGSTMHFLMALVLIFVALVGVGQPAGSVDPNVQQRDWRIASVTAGSGAAAAGLREGDRILSIGGRKVTVFDDVRTAAKPLEGKTVPVVFERDGKRQQVDVALKPFYQWFISRVPAGSPAAKAGLAVGDRIDSIDGTSTREVEDLEAVLDPLAGKTVPVTVTRLDKDGNDGQSATTELEITSLILRGNKVLLGISSDLAPAERSSVGHALVQTPKDFAAITGLSLQGLGRFFTPGGISDFVGQIGSAKKDNAAANPTSTTTSAVLGSAGTVAASDNRLMSMLGLIRLGGDVGAGDPSSLITLFALINIFIGVFNLVPLLPFDGGHVVIAVYERFQEWRLKRRRYFLDASKLLPLTYVVVAVMVLLFFSTIYLDIANPIQT